MDGEVNEQSLLARKKLSKCYRYHVYAIEQILLKNQEEKEKMKKVFMLAVSLSAIISVLCIALTVIFNLGIVTGALSVFGACAVGASYWAIEKYIFKI